VAVEQLGPRHARLFAAAEYMRGWSIVGISGHASLLILSATVAAGLLYPTMLSAVSTEVEVRAQPRTASTFAGLTETRSGVETRPHGHQR
jgi:hypothetical protein